MALPNHGVLTGYTQDISVGGVCIVLDDRIPQGVICPIRFELHVKGKIHTITTMARSVYGVFASQGGFRVGFEFKDEDTHRTALITLLAGKKPMVDTRPKESAPPAAPADPAF